MRRTSLLPLIALAFLAVATARAADNADAPQMSTAQQRSIVRGLDWLAQQVHHDRDQRWPARQPTTTQMDVDVADVAVASLEGLAFLGSGSDPARGEYRREINACLDHVLDSAKESGLISSGTYEGPMYGHGYATLFLSEVYGRTKDPLIEKKLKKAVALIVKAQNKEGGWRYTPQPFDADVSVTACELNALLAARSAGIDVDDAVVNRAVTYLDQCRNADGGYTYMAGQAGKVRSGTPRSAAAVAVLLHHGASPDDKQVSQSLGYVARTAFPGKPLPAGSPEADSIGHIWYLNYYASQALPVAGGDSLKAYQRLCDKVIAEQGDDGCWQGDLSPQYATACALIVLQAPDRQLWIYKPAT